VTSVPVYTAASCPSAATHRVRFVRVTLSYVALTEVATGAPLTSAAPVIATVTLKNTRSPRG
jgi:hypothetical protein